LPVLGSVPGALIIVCLPATIPTVGQQAVNDPVYPTQLEKSPKLKSTLGHDWAFEKYGVRKIKTRERIINLMKL